MDSPAFRRLLALDADVFEVAGIPQGVEVALEPGGVVDIARVGKDASLHRVRGDAAIAVNDNLSDQVLLRPSPGTAENDERKDQPCAGPLPPLALRSPKRQK